MGELLVFRDGELIKRQPLSETPVLAGRDETCDLCLPDGSVSRRHTAFVEKNGIAGLKDLDSTNGTFLNNQRVHDTQHIKEGDEIRVGKYLIQYKQSTEEAKQAQSQQTPTVEGLTDVIRVAQEKGHSTVSEITPEDSSQITIRTFRPTKEDDIPADAEETEDFLDEEEVIEEFSDEEEIVSAPVTQAPAETLIDVSAAEAPTPSGAERESEIVGEFYEAEGGDDIPMSTDLEDDTLAPIEIPAGLLEIIQKRLACLQELEQMGDMRASLLKDDTISEAVKGEYQRQEREAQKLPPASMLTDRLNKTNLKLDALKAPPPEETQEEEAPAPPPQPDMDDMDIDDSFDWDEVDAPPAPKKEEKKKPKAPPADPNMIQALEMGVRQMECIIARDALLPDIIKTALPLAQTETLYTLLQEKRIPADALFALAVYVVCLETIRKEENRKRKEYRQNLASMNGKKKGMLQRLRGSSEKEEEKREDLVSSEQASATLVTRIGREISALEPEMVEHFWKAYEEAACLLVRNDELGPKEKYLRAFLRHGLLGCAPWFISQEVSDGILQECENAIREWDYRMEAQHILYADEYLYFTAHAATTASINENLELNMRNSPEWRADKILRRIIFTRTKEAALLQLKDDLAIRKEKLHARQEKAEKRKNNLGKGAADYKQKAAQLGRIIQECKVDAVRLERTVERITEQYIPQQIEQRAEGKEKLSTLDVKITAEKIVRQEVAGVHRVCRLCANLKDHFLPFILRDYYKPDTDAVNSREVMLKTFEELEKADTTIFKDPLFPVKNVQHRTYIRYAPIILLAPSCGFLGYSWNPRAGVEIGRLVFPNYSPRTGLRDRILHDLMADFRYDTSKAAAGVDLLTSDTLVAAYATVRWEYRKRAKHIREKSAIYSEESDRKNWRRHYALFLISAQDQGKKLFYKCSEVYETVLKYIGLPEGVERMRK